VEHIDAKPDGIFVRQDLPETCETVFMNYPCLITVERGALIPRLPSYKRKKQLADKIVNIFHFNEFPDQDEGKYGLSGSPTKVIRMFPPEQNDMHEIWIGDSSVLTASLIDKLKLMKYM